MNRGPLLPPIWLLNHLLVMLAIHRLAPLAVLIEGRARWAGAVPIAGGIAVVLFCALRFKRMGTTIRPFEESSALLTEGPYRFSRNPIYLAMVVALAGVAILLGTLSPWLAIPSFVAIIALRFIKAEEEMLRERFGDEYDNYSRRVRRWI